MRSRTAPATDRRAYWVPAALSLFFLLLSAALWLILYRYTLVPNYYLVFLFGVPAAVLALAALHMHRRGGGDADAVACLTLSAACLVLGVLLLAGALFWVSIRVETTDLDRYEKLLSLSHYPDHPALRYFPAQIPGNAEGARMSYSSSPGGTTLALQYGADSGALARYGQGYERAARWSGSIRDAAAAEYGISGDALPFCGDLPADLTVYVLYFKGDETGTRNHGQYCIAAISPAAQEILYLYDKW